MCHLRGFRTLQEITRQRHRRKCIKISVCRTEVWFLLISNKTKPRAARSWILTYPIENEIHSESKDIKLILNPPRTE